MEALEPYVPPLVPDVFGGSLFGVVAHGMVPEDPYLVYLSKLKSERSRRAMAGCLGRITMIILAGGEPPPPGMPPASGAGRPWWLLRYSHTSRIQAVLGSPQCGYAPATINQHLAALRRVLEESWNLGLMSTDDWQRASRIKDDTGSRQPAGRNIHPDEIAAMLAACAADTNRPLGIRDAALITFLEASGVRRAEAAAALIENYDARDRFVKITGKGDKERAVPVHKDAVPHIERWLALLGSRQGPMFRPVTKGGRIGAHAVSPMAIAWVVSQRRKEAGLAPLSTHDFRRTFIGNATDAGVDVVRVAKVVGHADVRTTMKYDRRDDRGIRDAIDQMPLVVPAAGQDGVTGEGAAR